MARLNTHLSATPQPSARASTVDSLYRDPTPRLQVNGTSSARQSSYSVLSPAESMTSDKENRTPPSRQQTPQPLDSAKGKAMAAPGRHALRPPTPDSASLRNPNKRRRTANFTSDDMPTLGDATQDEGGEPSQAQGDDDDDDEQRWYNPHQDWRRRRELRGGYRNFQRELEDNRDEYIRPGSDMLSRAIPQASRLFTKVRQTTDATLDARAMVTMTDFSGKKLKATLHESTGVGIDLDQFVSRCIYYMKEGHPPGTEDAETQTRRPTQNFDPDDEESSDGLDWAYLGRHACFPCNRRPPLPSFLLGPLSVQRRVRTVRTRQARSQREPVGPTTRPEEVGREEIQQANGANITHLIKGIKRRLIEHIDEAAKLVEAELEEYEDVQKEDFRAACRRHRISEVPDATGLEEGEPAVSLFDFSINPDSFSQTVENLFYVSFLIREGAARIVSDENDLPLLVPAEPRTIVEQREHHIEKHQAIFSIDYPTWHAFIEAFDIKEPLIPHRQEEESEVATTGWRNPT